MQFCRPCCQLVRLETNFSSLNVQEKITFQYLSFPQNDPVDRYDAISQPMLARFGQKPKNILDRVRKTIVKNFFFPITQFFHNGRRYP